MERIVRKIHQRFYAWFKGSMYRRDCHDDDAERKRRLYYCLIRHTLPKVRDWKQLRAIYFLIHEVSGVVFDEDG